MNLTKSLIGRRKLLLGAVGSTCVLTCKKLAAFALPDDARASKSALHAAMAPEKASIAALNAAGNRCPHLLSPLRIRGRMLEEQNSAHRISYLLYVRGRKTSLRSCIETTCPTWPKANAAIVSMNTHYITAKTQIFNQKEDLDKDSAFYHYCDRTWEDLPTVYNYVNEMMDDIHYLGLPDLIRRQYRRAQPRRLGCKRGAQQRSARQSQ